jgi:restriction system protein
MNTNSESAIVPGFQHFMKPLLIVLSDKSPKHMRVIYDEVGRQMNLTPEQLNVIMPSQRYTLVNNRIGWARTYLFKAGLITQVSRGTYKISDDGLTALSSNAEINTKFLKGLPAFQNWLDSFENTTSDATGLKDVPVDEVRTPQEILDAAYHTITSEVADELLERIKQSPPAFFERLVVDLLLAMGYGGFDSSSGKVTQYSGDGGIDGIIKEDKLGLDKIYVQAKRWDNSVPVSAVRDFAGSLLSKKSKKGVFITTSYFPQSAYDYVKSIDPAIILIDGEQLTRLMIEYNVAVTKSKVYEIKRIDNDYFEL